MLVFAITFATIGFRVLYHSHAATGDINGDGKVDVLDLSVLAAHYGQTGQTQSTGDLNGDGKVTVLDLSILAGAWGTSSASYVSGPGIAFPNHTAFVSTTERDNQLNNAQQLGAKWVRLDLGYQHNPSYDALVDGATSRGMKVLAQMGSTGTAALGQPNTQYTPSTYHTVITNEVPWYYGKGARDFEILNEPNLHQYTPAQYLAIVQDAYTWIKQNYPDARVWVGAIGLGDTCNAGCQFNNFVKPLFPTIASYMDGFSIHASDMSHPPIGSDRTWSMQSWTWGPLGDGITDTIRSEMDNAGASAKPILLSEYNYPDNKPDQATQATRVTDNIADTRYTGVANYTIWDDPNDPSTKIYSMMSGTSPNYTKKLVWDAYKQAVAGQTYTYIGPSFQNEGNIGLIWRRWNKWNVAFDSTELSLIPRFRVFTMNAPANEYGMIPQIKAGSPGSLALVYKDLTSTRNIDLTCGTDPSAIATGVGYCDADANHPDWFLKDGSGNRIEYDGFPGHWQMDVGIAAYQDKWIANVIADVKAHGWDGVFMDNGLVHCNTYHKDFCPPKYPTDASLQAAYQVFLDKIGTAFSNAGLIAVANEADARLFPGLWSNYTRNLSGAYDEYWIEYLPGNMASGNSWKTQVDEIAQMEAVGKMAIVRAQTHFTDAVGAEFTAASYLLANGGHAVYDEGNDGTESLSWLSRPWLSWDLGRATNSYFLVSGSTSVYRRDFSAGTVVVNAQAYKDPTTQIVNPPQTVQLGGTYKNESGTSVTSVTLYGQTAAILRK